MDDQTKQTIDKLWAAMINYDWFADKIVQHPHLHKSLIVYVDTMSLDILRSIPDSIDGFDVCVHFVASIDDKYSAQLPSNKSANSLIDFVSSIETTSFEA